MEIVQLESPPSERRETSNFLNYRFLGKMHSSFGTVKNLNESEITALKHQYTLTEENLIFTTV